ncbi:F-type H+-transporting ATPase subunit epsilon [Butyrivibrio sp. INlla18]|jgi:F-type H+-transporting ATPase subunit epsilon|uniref:ATP synthase F1 subunit epsilon n=1 Tax=unclassified Butyrivibrio TaxID=2639466 RepID=UPI00087E0601|nr:MULTISPECIES: ATP synthase F1 subunit epsilon [unclassified Butyrivibrio]MBE5840582.1 ATP synthase F1 subunit epsilon [Butyrivibrio sp.]SDA57852.1 F-type H+-transporting ATPase subunit epsilon [Butyrivibrio sp. INlla18]
MSSYHLQVVSLDGLEFEGDVQKIMLRTIDGDVEILARHTNYCTAIGMGTAKVTMDDGQERKAACIGGMLSVMNGEVRVLPTTWEWSEDIDLDRAIAAKLKAEETLNDKAIDKEARIRAEAKLYRALVRIGSSGKDKSKLFDN